MFLPIVHSGDDVTRDMRRVFRPLPDTSGLLPTLPAPHPAPAVQRRRGLDLPGWTLPIAAGLAIGLTAFAVLSPAAPPSARSLTSMHMPAQPAQSPTMPMPASLSRTAPVAPASVSPRAAPRAQRVSLDAQRAVAQPRPSVAVTSGQAHYTPYCREARDREQCLYREVRDADHRLRRAYDRAVDASLPLPQLVQVRRAWGVALAHYPRDPMVAIGQLDGLATRLYNRINSADAGGGDRASALADDQRI